MVLAKSLNEDNKVVLQHMFTGAFSVAWKATWDETQRWLLKKETNWLINFAFLAVWADSMCYQKKKKSFFFCCCSSSKERVLKTEIHGDGYIYIGKCWEY